MSEQLKTRVLSAIRAVGEDHGATLDALAAQPDLMTLECVVAAASDYGRIEPDRDVVAGVVQALLEDAANSLEAHPTAQTDPNRAAAARAAIAVAPGLQGRPFRGRRGRKGRIETVASRLGYQSPSTMKPRQDGRSELDALFEDIAEYVVRREVDHLVAERRLAQRARRPPLESAMHVDWLARFERYAQIYTYIAAMRYDIELAVQNHREGDSVQFNYFLRNSLWYYGNFLLRYMLFIHDHGNLWIVPDPRAEQTIAESVWFMCKATPMTEIDESIMRLAVDGYKELAIFVDATYSDQALRRLLEKWRPWIESCGCANLKRPRKRCPVHESLAWATVFMTNINAQWDLLADWYQAPRPAPLIKPLELSQRTAPRPQANS